MKKMLVILGAACALVLGVGGYVDADELARIAKSIDIIWVLVAAFLVFFMQAGFACLEAGFTRAKNVSNVIMKGVMDFCLTSIVFWAVGYRVMFGADKAGLFGTSNFFMSLAVPGSPEGLWQFAYYMFQVAFAGAAATIVAGAIAERAKFTAYLGYVIAVAALIYPLVGHWIWGGGWLGNLGMVDFAGSAVVHSVGGWAAFAGRMVQKPETQALLKKFGRRGTLALLAGLHKLIGSRTGAGMWSILSRAKITSKQLSGVKVKQGKAEFASIHAADFLANWAEENVM